MIEGPDAPLWPAPIPARPIDLLGVGQISLDHVGRVDRLPRFGGKRELDAYAPQPGGQVATAVLAAARLGLRAAWAGAVGDDPAAETVLAPLRRAGVDLSGAVHIAGVPTRLALILVESASGERMVLSHRDPRLLLRPESLERKRIEAARVLHLDATDPDASLWAAGVAREAGVAVMLDADAPWDGYEALLRRVDFPVVSREFAENLSGTGLVRDGLKAVSSFGARLAVVTLASGGAIAATAAGAFGSPAFRVTPRDTTGAGDAFHGAFAWALLQGCTAREALRQANAAAGHNCEAFGAQGGLPTRKELAHFLGERRPRPWRDPDEAPAREAVP
jgi:sulfofructose kinase